MSSNRRNSIGDDDENMGDNSVDENGSGDCPNDISAPADAPPIHNFDNIGGLEDQKNHLIRSVILPLSAPELFQDWGMKPPKGILFHGPPGTGKTQMAKALVGELQDRLKQDVTFIYRKGGDVFSQYFGESEENLRNVFKAATENEPSVLFFDEIDGLAPSRENDTPVVYHSIVTCFLGLMDEVIPGTVFVVAATNRLEAVDPAVRRPGRFDKHLEFGFPDETARRQILKIYTDKWSEEEQPSNEVLIEIAKITEGFSGADLQKLCHDVVYTAIDANDGILNEHVKVTKEHWIQTLNGMQRSALDTFGSALFVPAKPPKIVKHLISPVVNQAVGQIRDMLTKESLDIDSKRFAVLRNRFLLHQTTKQSKSFLDEVLLPGILTHRLFHGMSFFRITIDSIFSKAMSHHKPTMLAAITDVINQARDTRHTTPCSVVIIPSLNEVLHMAEANKLSSGLVLNALNQISGPRMFLVATSSVDLKTVINQFPDLYPYFSQGNRLMKVDNPSGKELQSFFKHSLSHIKKSLGSSKQDLYDWIVREACEHTNGLNFELVLHLRYMLNTVEVRDCMTEEELTESFQSIFAQFMALV